MRSSAMTEEQTAKKQNKKRNMTKTPKSSEIARSFMIVAGF
jgi:flagellar biosynthesis protein FlhB